MSAREWQPGDVAMVGYDGQPERPMLRAEVERAHSLRACWLDPAYRIYEDQGRVQSARPLVVIDPEDREQTARLADLFCAERWCHTRTGDTDECDPLARSSMQAALREFANPTPPKPAEPTGLGAVVEDASQVEYIHLGSGLWVYGTTDGPSQGYFYDDIDAVRVLSEGVTQ